MKINDKPRRKQIGRLKRILLKYSQPKFQMFLIMLLTASIGAGASFVLLKAGLTAMWLRYPVAAIIAYLAFLVILRAWVHHRFGAMNIPPDANYMETDTDTGTQRSIWKTHFIDFVDLSCAIDDFPAAVLFLAASGVIVVILGIIIAAPVLMAEVLVDGFLVAGLYHRFKRYGEESSLGGAVRTTILPVIIVVICLVTIGFIFQAIEPRADSIGDLFRRGDSGGMNP